MNADSVARAMQQGLFAILHSVLPTGEIPVWKDDPLDAQGGSVMCSNVLASALAHESLAALDPSAEQGETRALQVLGRVERRRVAIAITALRARLRRFLAWQESADGAWALYGRSSGLPGDAPTTACAALCLLEGKGPRRAAPARLATLRRHRRADGTYCTSLSNGRAIADPDPVFNAHILRFCHLTGEPREALSAWIAGQVLQPDRAEILRHHASLLCFYHAAARAYSVAYPETRQADVERLAEQIVALRRADGGFGGGVSTALAVHALLDLELLNAADGPSSVALSSAELLSALRDTVCAAQLAERYFADGVGSPQFNLCLIVSALGRLAARQGVWSRA